MHPGALEVRIGQGYLGAVIVNQPCGGKPGVHEVHRDAVVCGGHKWLTSEEALQHGLLLGAAAVKAERHRKAALPDPSTARERADV